jgi:hypothetical protein
MSDESFNQTDEKLDEKQQEKITEKSPEEKAWDEKARRDPLSSMLWAGILIWAGVAFLIQNLGLLRSMGLPASFDGWSLVFAGAGVILMVGVLIRLAVPEYRGPVVGQVILGMVFLSIGLGDTYGWQILGPVAIIIIGMIVLFRAFRSNV